MKTPDSIKAVIAAMCSAVKIDFVRAEQNGPRPKGLFLSYKVISQEGEPAWRNASAIEAHATDPALAVIRTAKKSAVTVSFTIPVPAGDHGDAWNAAIACLAWLDSDEARAVYEAQGIVPRFVPVTVHDRTAFLETGFEPRLGFDVGFTGVTASTENVDAVDIESTITNLPEA